MFTKIKNKVLDAASDETTRNVFLTVAVRVLAAVFGLAMQVLLARTMELGEYGIYVILWTWICVINQLGVVGFTDSSMRYVPRYVKRNKTTHLNGFYSTGFFTVLSGSTVLVLIGLTLLTGMGDWLEEGFYFPCLLVLVGIPLLALESYLNGVSRGLGWYMFSTIPAFIVRPFLIMLAVCLAYLGGYTVDASFVFSIILVITACVIAFQAVYIRSKIADPAAKSANSRQRKFWIWSSVSLLPAMMADEIFVWCDVLLLGFFATPEQTSVYFAAQRSLSLAAFVQFAFMLVAARNFSITNTSADKVELQRQITRSTNATFLLTIPSVLLTLIAGYPLLFLFGPDFLNAYPAMIILGFAYILRSLTGQAPDLLVILGKHKIHLIISAASIVLCIIGMWILVPMVGINGAAATMAMVYALRAVAYTILTQRETGYWVLASPRFTAKIATA